VRLVAAHTAADDYPVLEEILEERLPLEHAVSVTAAQSLGWKELTKPVRCQLKGSWTFVGDRTVGPEIGMVSYGREVRVSAGTEGTIKAWRLGDTVPVSYLSDDGVGVQGRGKHKTSDYFLVVFATPDGDVSSVLTEDRIELLDPIPRRKTGSWQVVDDAGTIHAGPVENKYVADELLNGLREDPQNTGYILYVQRSTDDGAGSLFEDGWGAAADPVVGDAFGDHNAKTAGAFPATGRYAIEHPGSMILGLLGGQVWYSVGNGTDPHGVTIHAVFVEPSARRIGIGTALLDALAQQFAGHAMDPGGMTTDGSALWESWVNAHGWPEVNGLVWLESEESFFAESSLREGGWLDRKIDQFAENTSYIPGRNYSVDWCRFRREQHCWYPRRLDGPETARTGIATWVPEDRGYCPRNSWDAQKACPAPSQPGPNSHERNAQPDATRLPFEAAVEIRTKVGAVPSGWWSDHQDVFGAESKATVNGYDLVVSTVITSADELEIGWFVYDPDNPDDEVAGGYVEGLNRQAWDQAKAEAERAVQRLPKFAGQLDSTYTFTGEGLYQMLGEVALPPYPDGEGGVVGAGLDQDCAPIASLLESKVEEYRIAAKTAVADPEFGPTLHHASDYENEGRGSGEVGGQGYSDSQLSGEYGDARSREAEGSLGGYQGSFAVSLGLGEDVWSHSLWDDVAPQVRAASVHPAGASGVHHAGAAQQDSWSDAHGMQEGWASLHPREHTNDEDWARLSHLREGKRTSQGSVDDREWRFHITARWSDVRAKAKRIRGDGHVRIIAATPGYVVAEVRGDTNIYQTQIMRAPGSKTAAMWECGCAWANYSWARSGRWKKYEGRMCSHALALLFEAQSREMFGREIQEDRNMPQWRTDPAIPVIRPGDARTKPQPWRVGHLTAIGYSPFVEPWTPMMRKMVDHKEDRPLADPKECWDLRAVLPKVRWTSYVSMPFFAQLMALQGSEPTKDAAEKLVGDRKSLFGQVPVRPHRVQLDRLVLTQPTVNGKKVQEMIDNGISAGGPPALLVHWKGDDYVIDGHHRLVAQLMQGIYEINVKTLDLDAHPEMLGVKTAMPALKANPTMDDIVAWYVKATHEEEPRTSRDVQTIANDQGGLTVGFTYRFKDPAKVEDKIRRKNLSSGDPRYWIQDALRYTIVFHPAVYSTGLRDALYEFEEKGYRILTEENSWMRGDSYSGLHYNIETPGGLMIEVQFHTDDSYVLKQRTLHKFYEEFRGSGTSLRRKQELWDLMTKYWDSVEIPKDVLNFPHEKWFTRPAHLVPHIIDTDPSLAMAPVEAIRKEADLMGRVRGIIKRIKALVSLDQVRLDDGSTVPASEVEHPDWTTRRGLDYHEPRQAAFSPDADYEVLVSARGNAYAHIGEPGKTANGQPLAVCGTTVAPLSTVHTNYMGAMAQATCPRCVQIIRTRHAMVREAMGPRDTPVASYGLRYDAHLADTPEVKAAKGYSDWNTIGVSRVDPHDLWATEAMLASSSVDKVVSGTESLRRGYDAHVLKLADGRLVIIDGHHRAAMAALRNELLAVHVLDISANMVLSTMHEGWTHWKDTGEPVTVGDNERIAIEKGLLTPESMATLKDHTDARDWEKVIHKIVVDQRREMWGHPDAELTLWTGEGPPPWTGQQMVSSQDDHWLFEAAEEPEEALEPCDHFEPLDDEPDVCRNCFWAIGAHDAKAGGTSSVGRDPYWDKQAAVEDHSDEAVATLHDEPEPAIPQTDGSEEDHLLLDDDEVTTPISRDFPREIVPMSAYKEPEASAALTTVTGPAWLAPGASNGNGRYQASIAVNREIAGMAQRFLKEGAKAFTPAEQAEIINEGAADGTRAANLDLLDIAGTHYEMLSEQDQEDEGWL
jgi:GNAT superfamily N-acetyltransferase